MKKLCIFANDPLIRYYEKGEIKERYFNPENFFDEVHFISFIDQDIKEEKIQKIVGNAKLEIHSVGKISLTKREKEKKRIMEVVKKIQPDIIRAYNPRLEGWFAANCAKNLKIPFYLSLHTQFDTNRKIASKFNLKKYLGLKINEKVIEPFVIKSADVITIVFKIIEPFVIKNGGKKPILLYNSIDCEKFYNAIPIINSSSPLILSVGNLIREKSHDIIINAMKEIEASCLIIGKGPEQKKLEDMIEKLGLKERVEIKETIPHDKIHEFFKSATIFALAFNPELEALPIPVMEAMAAAKPVVISKSNEKFAEDLGDSVIYAKRNSEDFRKKINQILEDKHLQIKLGQKAHKEAERFEKKKIERKEMEIYVKLLHKEQSNS